MPNLFDYLTWRGDLSFQNAPVCEADELLLAQLSYIFFDGLYEDDMEQGVLLKDAVQAVLERDSDAKTYHQIMYMWKDNRRLLQMLLESNRYKNLEISNYRSFQDDEVQFGALFIKIKDGLNCVSFRGTDDSIVGWKEDFELSYNKPVKAQVMSEEYLKEMAQKYPQNLLVVGHSKGGNLAIYASARMEQSVKDRIVRVVSCDGPGLNHAMIETENYKKIYPKIEKFVPQSSIVGMLLEYDDKYTVISSDSVGIMQHSAFSWQILGASLVRRAQPTQISKYLNSVVKAWLDEMPVEKRKLFVKAVFETIAKTKLTSVDQIDLKFILSLPSALLKMYTVDSTLRTELHKEMRSFLKTAIRPVLLELHTQKSNEQKVPNEILEEETIEHLAEQAPEV